MPSGKLIKKEQNDLNNEKRRIYRQINRRCDHFGGEWVTGTVYEQDNMIAHLLADGSVEATFKEGTRMTLWPDTGEVLRISPEGKERRSVIKAVMPLEKLGSSAFAVKALKEAAGGGDAAAAAAAVRTAATASAAAATTTDLRAASHARIPTAANAVVGSSTIHAAMQVDDGVPPAYHDHRTTTFSEAGTIATSATATAAAAMVDTHGGVNSLVAADGRDGRCRVATVIPRREPRATPRADGNDGPTEEGDVAGVASGVTLATSVVKSASRVLQRPGIEVGAVAARAATPQLAPPAGRSAATDVELAVGSLLSLGQPGPSDPPKAPPRPAPPVLAAVPPPVLVPPVLAPPVLAPPLTTFPQIAGLAPPLRFPNPEHENARVKQWLSQFRAVS